MKSKFTCISIMVFGVILFGMPAIYAADVQPEHADSAYPAAMEDHIAALEEIAANRDAVIEELVQKWFMDIPDWEAEFKSLLNLANDSKLLAILNAENYAEVQAVLSGGTPDFYSADSMADPFALGDSDNDFVYTAVKPCRIVDTRIAGGKISSGGSRGFYVYGSGSHMSPQGGNSAGCTSPKGEPRAVHINIVAVESADSGWLTVWPYGASKPLAGVLNYSPGKTDPISNAFTVKTGYALARDISVYAHKTTHVVADVMGYYYHGEPIKIVAAASTGTQAGGVTVTDSYTTLVSKAVYIPANGRIILMGEASWHNSGSKYLQCQFLEYAPLGLQVDSWFWDAGDDDSVGEHHQTRFFYKTVSSGAKTYSLRCRRINGIARAYFRNLTIQFIREGLKTPIGITNGSTAID